MKAQNKKVGVFIKQKLLKTSCYFSFFIITVIYIYFLLCWLTAFSEYIPFFNGLYLKLRDFAGLGNNYELVAMIQLFVRIFLIIISVLSVIIYHRFFSRKTTILVLCNIFPLLFSYLLTVMPYSVSRKILSELSENMMVTISIALLIISLSIIIIYFLFMIRSVIKDFKDFQLKAN